MRAWRSLIVVGALAAVATASCKRTGPRVWTGPEDTGVAQAAGQMNYRFGVVGRTNVPGSTRLLGDLGVGWIRVPVTWSQVQPRPSSHNWDKVAEAVASQARTRPGMRAMVTLEAKSPWAGRQMAVEVREKATVPPRDLDAYYQFVHGIASRGRGVVDCWQIENEMESRHWWAGTSGDYLALLRTAHRAVRSADPGAKIAVGGFTSQTMTAGALLDAGESKGEIARQLGFGEIRGRDTSEVEAGLRRSLAFVDDVFANGRDYFDIVDIHLYHSYETIPLRVEWLRGKMRENGCEKPIWATEVGGPDPLVVSHNEQVQAQEVVKRVALALASGVERVFWLGLTEMDDQGERFNRMGLVTIGGRRKPAFRAYQLVVRKLDDVEYGESLNVPAGHGLQFQRQGQPLWVLWADHGARLRLETGRPSVLITYLNGREERRSTVGGSLMLDLTADPIFVEADSEQ